MSLFLSLLLIYLMVKSFSSLVCMFSILFCIAPHAYGSWKWAKSATTNVTGAVLQYNYSTTDKNGNTCIALETEWMGSPPPGTYYFFYGNDSITFVEPNYYYLMSVDSNGAFRWAVPSTYGFFNQVLADGSGNIYFTGYYNSDTMSVGNSILLAPSSGSTYSFMGKISSTGQVLWLKNISESSQCTYAAVDSSNNFYLAGYFSGPHFSFGTGTLNNNGSQDIFVAKTDSAGNPVWLKQIGGDNLDFPKALAVSPGGNVCVAGTFLSDSLTFGAANIKYVPNDVYYCPFVAHLTSTGIYQRVDTFKHVDNIYNLLIDDWDNTYITGYTNNVQSHTFFYDNVAVSQPDNSNYFFMLKQKNNGNLNWHWVRPNNIGTSLLLDRCDNIWLVDRATAPGNAGDTLQIYRCDSAGVLVDSAGGISGGNTASGLFNAALDNMGHLFVTGYYQYAAAIIGSDTLQMGANDLKDLFVARYDYTICQPANTTSVLNTNAASAELYYYPNPFNSELHIRNGSPGSKYIITNLLGQNISYGEIFYSDQRISTLSWAEGIYIVQTVFPDGSMRYQKVIKE